jgi:drug/metabolite transporter (DMT)-like permease
MTEAVTSAPGNAVKSRSKEAGVAQVSISVIAFASLPILVKLGFRQHLGVWQLLVLRSALGGVGLMALVWFVEGADTVRRALGLRTMATGLLFCVNSVLFFGALHYVSASLAVLLLFIHPALVAFAKRILAHEVPDRPTQIALVSSLAGSALLVTSFHVRTAAGVAVCLALPLSYAGFLLVAERTGTEVCALATSASTLIAAIPVTGTACFIFSGSISIPTTRGGWLVLLGVTACYLVGMPALVGALSRLGATATAIIGATEPVVTLALAALVISERLAPMQVLGGALVVAAAFIAVSRTRLQALSPA